LQRFFLRGSSFGKTGIPLFGSTKAVSASAVYVSGGMDIEMDAESGTEISMALSKAPASVVINDQPVKNFKFDKKTGLLRVAVPAGYVMVKIRMNV
jgi:hypothetical protein